MDNLRDLNAVMDSYVIFRKEKPARWGDGVALNMREQQESVELCLGMNDEWVESLWVRIKGLSNIGDVTVGIY